MKKFFFFLVIMNFLINYAISQAITKEFFKDTGTITIYARDNVPNYTWSLMENTNNWDISQLVKDDSVTVKVLDPQNTNWANQITGSNYVMTFFSPNDSIYYYYNLTDTGIFNVGIVSYSEGNFVPFKYDEQKLFMPFPFNVGDTIYSPKTATTSLYNIPITLTHNDSLIYLLTGTLTLPNKTIEVGLIKHYSYINVYAQNIVNTTYEDYILEWYELYNDKKLIASADTSISLSKFVSILFYEHVDSATTFIPEFLSKVLIYPNPTTNKITIKNLPPNSKILITDLQGKTYISIPYSNQKEINISSLPSGTYILRIKQNNIALDIKFIKL